ncbi:MAG: HU family DNA-binding protein [Tannerella sp.]|jgi:nucleoid DNA-binding protein|nr:HU family DNA-binding protein [Tannerella sp.]
MSERLNNKNLAEILADHSNLDKKQSEKFINIISDYITNGIEKNRFVKVMGLGTFKILLVRERESVHIQTGERFVIPAHHKLSFNPDKFFKDHINRPFAFFEPIETNNESSLEDMPVEADDTIETEMEKAPEAVLVGENVEENVEDVESIEENINVAENVTEEVVAIEEETVEYEPVKEEPIEAESLDDEPVKEEIVEAESFDEEPVEEFIDKNDEPESDDEYADNDVIIRPAVSRRRRHGSRKDEREIKVPLWVWFVLLPLLIVVGIGAGTFAFLRYNSKYITQSEQYNNVVVDDTQHSPLPIGSVSQAADSVYVTDEFGVVGDSSALTNYRENIGVVAPVESESETANAKTDTAKTNERRVIDWLAPSQSGKKEQVKRVERPNQDIERKNKDLPSTQKDLANTKPTTTEKKTFPARVRMTAGSSLTQIALEYYGDKIFWVYLYEYNKARITNFNNIPVGTEIRIPDPKTYGINAKSKASIEKATLKQRQLMNWNNWDDYR